MRVKTVYIIIIGIFFTLIPAKRFNYNQSSKILLLIVVNHVFELVIPVLCAGLRYGFLRA